MGLHGDSNQRGKTLFSVTETNHLGGGAPSLPDVSASRHSTGLSWLPFPSGWEESRAGRRRALFCAGYPHSPGEMEETEPPAESGKVTKSTVLMEGTGSIPA